METPHDRGRVLRKGPAFSGETNLSPQVNESTLRFTLAAMIRAWERRRVMGLIHRGNLALAGFRGIWAWALGIGATLGFSARPASSPVLVDEIYWIGSAYYFHLATGARDLAHPDWRLLPARENPPVAKFVIGTSLAAAGQAVTTPDLLGAFYLLFEGTPGAWGGAADQAKRRAVVSRMTVDERKMIITSGRVNLPANWLQPARLGMITCVFFASLALFLIGRGLVGAIPALLASLCLPLHPIASEALNHALSDAPAMMFSIGATGLLAVCLRAEARGHGSCGRRGALALSAGAAAGLSCATKMNALVILPVAAAGFGFLLVRAFRSAGFRACLTPLILAGVFMTAALMTFLAVNPALHGDWWLGVQATVEEHRITGRIQASFLQDSLKTFPERLSAVGLLLASSRWAWLPLLAAALLLLSSSSMGHRFVAAWWLSSWLLVSIWIPFPWLRYAAPMVAPSMLLLAACADWLISKPRAASAFLRGPGRTWDQTPG